ncbi:MAG: hypothetical protein HC926_00055 [Synechococcaceae cyanobacterium SM2_3_60]|nr:hypothetical protein [Synechococcaceae cyanobacterium SM2_3_60]
MQRAVLVCLGLVFSATAAQAQPFGPVFQVEFETDRPGADLATGYAASFEQCLSDCAGNGECAAFTWVDVRRQPGQENEAPLCWLKGETPEPLLGTGMISGVRQ